MQRPVLRILLAACIAVAAASGAAAAECDNALAPLHSPEGYKPRSADPRCEGFFVSPVSGPPVELVSFTRGTVNYDLQHTDRLAISLAVARQETGQVHLRAVGIPANLYYRMDADLPPSGAFGWPVHDVLANTGLTRDRVGVFAFTRTTAGALIYMPVSVGLKDLRPANLAAVTVTLRPLTAMLDPKLRFVQGQEPFDLPISETADRLTADLPAGHTGPGTLEVTWTDSNGQRRVRQFAVAL